MLRFIRPDRKQVLAATGFAVAFGFFVLGVSGCKEPSLGRSVGGGKGVDEGAVLNAISEYREWRKINAARFAVPTAIAVKCGPSGAPANKTSQPKHGHPANSYLNVFINDRGLVPLERMQTTTGRTTFPIGTVLVKERYSGPEQDVPDLLVVMIKRGFEYNSDSANWEFSVVSGDGAKVLDYGKLKNCASCHAQAKTHDYVITGYR